MESKIKPMQDFDLMQKRHEEGTLTYSDILISDGAVKGLDNKAKVISHRDYGLRSVKKFVLNLYNFMVDLPMPASLHRFV